MLYARPATEQDAHYLAPRLREVDVREMQALSGSKPLDALLRGVRESSKCFTITDGENPVAMFGVAPSHNGKDWVGAVWLLGTDELVKHSLQFLRESRKWFKELTDGLSEVFNFVLSDNHVHIRWLNWLGVKWFPYYIPAGINDHAFLKFSYVRTN